MPAGLTLLAVMAVGGGWLWYSGRNIESTDDAYTDGRAVLIAPQVAGAVVALDVADNQFVRKGDPLIHIDPRQYQIARELAEADPLDPASNLNLAILYLESGMTAEATTQCRHNLQFDIAPAATYAILAQTFEQTGNLDAARAAYQSSLSLDPHNPVTLELLRQFDSQHPVSP